RLISLQRLLDEGVEVVGTLIDVDETRGESDFRLATYRYEYGGVTYAHTIAGTDFFMGRATRYGDRIALVIDPARPTRLIVVGRAA
ncbi:MAG TPA: hypothetical protein VJP45_05810, partial [Candidatus Limnocylindria bacterium]|nr:hypothetical protein [Candidatus Limnocylindria bacterium]